MYGRILIERVKDEENNGIEIAKSKDDHLFKGIIISLGDEPYAGFEVGQTVIFPSFAGTLLHAEGIEYYIVREEDILIRIEE